jgi:xylose isomerase
MDAIARGLLRAARMLERGDLARAVDARYAGWDGALGRAILAGERSFEDLERVALSEPEPRPVSGRQERLENLVNRDAL